MCQSSAYLVKGDAKELIMEDVSDVTPENGELLLKGFLGEEKRIKAKIKELKLTDHQILLEEV